MPRGAGTAIAVGGSLCAALAFCVAGCGSEAQPPSTATSAGGVTSAPSPTPLFTGGTTASASPSSTPAGPVLSVTQLGFRMSFSPGLGSVSYAIDSSHAGPVTDANGTTATYTASVGLASGAYAATACAASSPFEASIEVYTTGETQLRFASGPSQWVRAGPHLLGFVPPQSSPCSADQVSHDLPLLQQMFSTAVPN